MRVCSVELLAGVCIGLTALSTTFDSHACTPFVEPVSFVNESFPADGASGVPLNAGLVLTGADSGLSGAGGGFALHSLSLSPRGGEPVSGSAWGTLNGALIWAPDKPLDADTTYDAVVRAGASGDTALVESQGLIEEYSFAFTTGTQVLTGLTFAEPLSVDIEVVQETTPRGCGCSACPSTEPFAVVWATLRIPAVTGGNEATGYRGVVDYTSGEPSGLDAKASRPPGNGLLGTAYFEAAVGQEQQVRLELSEDAPCFQVTVWDSGGQTAVTDVCVPELDLQALLDTTEDATSNVETTQKRSEPSTAPEGVDSPQPQGCSMSRSSAPVAPDALLGALGLATALLLQRRKAR